MSRKEKNLEQKLAYAKTLTKGTFDPSKYEYTDKFIAGDPNNPETVHTVAELAECLRKNSKVGFDGIAIHANTHGRYYFKRINKEKFLRHWEDNSNIRKVREAVDYFGTDAYPDPSPTNANAGLVGDDYIPLLGGPFNKQLYFTDALRMFALAFHAYHHDPVARSLVSILCDFVLGRGFRVDAKCADQSKQQIAQALWAAFEEANKLQDLIELCCKESSIYGELMLWKLPNNQSKITYQLSPGQSVPKGMLPRYRLMDPSTCWEIVTYPEDITRVICYDFIYPTQYQIYTAKDGGSQVPSSKFIMQQIPADQIRHYRINRVSNEKRGRSDLFPILGYLKRLRDSVDYDLIAKQKAAAYSIDTTIEGSQTDIDNYIQSQNDIGTIAPAGSEFVHTKRVVRQYLANQSTSHGSGENSAFMSALNMICIGFGVPVSYLGSHMTGGQSRASALVGTEPVAKRFQKRQNFLKSILVDMANDLMKDFGITGVDWEVTFPEIITQDRSAKMKDIYLAKDEGTISKRRASEMVAKELDIGDYDYESEQDEINSEAPEDQPIHPTLISPLTMPAVQQPGQDKPKSQGADDPTPDQNKDNTGSSDATAITQNARRKLSMNNGA